MKGLGRAQEIPFLMLAPLLCDLGQVIHPLWTWESAILKRLSPSLRSLPPPPPPHPITSAKVLPLPGPLCPAVEGGDNICPEAVLSACVPAHKLMKDPR